MITNGEKVAEVSFSVNGEYVTQLAREKCHHEGKFDYAVKFLMDCMLSDQLSEREIRHMAIDILDGYAELRGTYPGDDYGLEYLDKKDERWDLGATFARLREKRDAYKLDAAKQLGELRDKYCFVCENLSEWKRRELNREYHSEFGEWLFEEEPIRTYYKDDELDEGSEDSRRLVNEFMSRQLADTKADDYGWLEPDGTFHPVEWCEHQEWAEKYIRERMTKEQWLEAGTHLDNQFQSAPYNTFGDWLVERGWVLLHSPGQGVGRPTKNPTKDYTKAQRDFLYGYYIDRGLKKEANEIMKDREEYER